jgi:transcriptional regulator NrdR family protein
MSQVTIYLEAKQVAAIKGEAKRSRKSVSKWVAEAVQQRLSREWPDEFIRAAGTWNDFPDITDLRKSLGKDSPRERI